MRIGIAPINWTNDDFPQLGGHIPFDQCISEMALAGYEGCEVGTKYPKNPIELLKHLTLRNLEICNYWFSFELTSKSLSHNLEQLKKHIAFQKAVNCKIIGGAEIGNSSHVMQNVPVFKERGKLNSVAQWKEYGSKLNECGRLIEDNGLELAYHNHVGTIVQNIEDAERLIENTDRALVKLNYDSGHFHFAGDDPVDALDRTMEHVIHVHLKDVRPRVLDVVNQKKLSFRQAVTMGIFTVPGDKDGVINFDEIFKILRANNYNRWAVIEAEQDPTKANPLEYAMAARTYIRGKTGF